ncbi:shikimate dehydrogenase family protein [Trueperella bialowiezensis]|uniref:Shikimate dehydrogenase (NADP(+)) n=1 Tax=Trueperella bialowiezensis TaxID=312285 RepID=A0A448PBT1_9ACTO|nr:shikimate dehydrogenase [Trueperella bialowiezensis]VEI12366.1 Shikimate dehydrogenase [Trueperella bialowiezensis]
MSPFPHATTAVFAILGRPAIYSKSPHLHNAVFRHLGIDAVYVAHEPSDLGRAIAGMNELGYSGANLTMPFKSEALRYLDGVSDVAREMNAVNTLSFRDGRVYGDNTDGAGLLNEIRKTDTEISGASIVLLGTGGAASAVWTQAALDGAARVHVFNRMKPEFPQIQETLARLGDKTGTELTLYDVADEAELRGAVADSSIIINATSVGMGEMADRTLIPAAWITKNHTVADAVYHPRITRLIAEARESGAKTVEGIRMLLGQAAICEKIWLGIDMPYDVAEAAVLDS